MQAAPNLSWSHRVLALALCSMLGCYAPYFTRPGTLPPATATVAPAQRVEVWNRAITVLLAGGWVPQVLNEGACFISAKRRDDLVDDNLAGGFVFVQIDPGGILTIQIAGGGRFRSQDDLNATIQAFQDKILAGVVDTPVPPPRR
jgi:hypothetical protein